MPFMKKKKTNNIEDLFRKKLNESSDELSDDHLFEDIFSSYTRSIHKNTSNPESKNIINLYKHHLQNVHTNSPLLEAERTQIFNAIYSSLIRRKYLRLFTRVCCIILLSTGAYLLYHLIYQPYSKTNIHKNNNFSNNLALPKKAPTPAYPHKYLNKTSFSINEPKAHYTNNTDAQGSKTHPHENKTKPLNNEEYKNPTSFSLQPVYASTPNDLSLSNQNNLHKKYKNTYPPKNVPSFLAASKKKLPQENPIWTDSEQTGFKHENNQNISPTSHINHNNLSEVQNTAPLDLIPIKSIHSTIPEIDVNILKDTTPFSFVFKPQPVYYLNVITGLDKDSYTILQKATNDYPHNFSVSPRYYSLALGIGTGIEYKKLFVESNILYSQKQTIKDSISLYKYANGKESIIKEYYHLQSKYIRWNLNLGYHFVQIKNFRIGAIAGANFYQNYFNNGSVIQKEYASDKTVTELVISLSPQTVRINYHYGIRINYHYRSHAWAIGAMQNIYATNMINTPDNNTSYYTNFQFKTLSIYFQYAFAIKH